MELLRSLKLDFQTHTHQAFRARLPLVTAWLVLPQFLKIYNHRAGIEGTISQGVRRSALRQSRYIGLVKTHLQHTFMAAALNLCRLDAWLNGIPLAPSRYSGFMTLKPK